MLFALIGLATYYTYRRHRQKIRSYEQSISTLQEENSAISRQYQNVVADTVQDLSDLTDDDKAFVTKLTNIIEILSEKGVTDVETIAEHMHINTVTLRRRLSQTLSVTPKGYIMRVRMEKAKFLLQNYRDLAIADVADKCGYSQVPNFTRAFKNYFGMMPSDAKLLTDAKDAKDLITK